MSSAQSPGLHGFSPVLCNQELIHSTSGIWTVGTHWKA